MKSKERYQQLLEAAYYFAPFHLIEVIDMKHANLPQIPPVCMVCGNKRLRYLCHCTGKNGTIWYIGRDCHTKLEERQEQERLHGHS